MSIYPDGAWLHITDTFTPAYAEWVELPADDYFVRPHLLGSLDLSGVDSQMVEVVTDSDLIALLDANEVDGFAYVEHCPEHDTYESVVDLTGSGFAGGLIVHIETSCGHVLVHDESDDVLAAI